MFKHREAAYAILRITVGVMFLFFGIGKFMAGVGNFAGGMAQHFAGKLPSALVLPFGYVLPFAEVTLGTLILLGLFSEFALSLSGLLLGAYLRYRHARRRTDGRTQRSVRADKFRAAVLRRP